MHWSRAACWLDRPVGWYKTSDPSSSDEFDDTVASLVRCCVVTTGLSGVRGPMDVNEVMLGDRTAWRSDSCLRSRIPLRCCVGNLLIPWGPNPVAEVTRRMGLPESRARRLKSIPVAGPLVVLRMPERANPGRFRRPARSTAGGDLRRKGRAVTGLDLSIASGVTC